MSNCATSDLTIKSSEKCVSCANVEIKAKVRNKTRLVELAESISDSKPEILYQTDVFYNSPNGRLKSRVIKGVKEELIFYDRPDVSGPKSSEFLKIDGASGEITGKIGKLLEKSMGIKGALTKKRLLYLVGQTRIHIDEVESLGCFMELEVVMNPEQTAEEGQMIARNIMKSLEIREEDLVTGAYLDLIQEGQRHT